MNLHFEHANLTELSEIMTIENAGFSPAEAATETAMKERISLYPDTFITAKSAEDQLVGYIVGPAFDQRYLTDELFNRSHPNRTKDRYQTVLSLAAHPNFRGQGVASQLLTELAKVAKAQNRIAITLTCLANLVSFYEQNGYQNEGISASSHAGETWYNMVFTLE
ncbi:GNAT family N-acetyltransferase [Lentilactobacillus otakiensis]|uniref:GNAT family N-acetyltransferase n=1 Tax=Lentilactobacillus otakiensis TaxID=481720 RepID=UPI003D176FB4